MRLWEALDIAIAAGKAEYTGRANARPCRCVVCRALCAVGEGRRLWIDGHKRGFICPKCQWDQGRYREEKETEGA